MTAHLAGDSNTSKHLAYYGELRAAIATLATQGIGVFNRVHVAVETSGETRLFKGHGTHLMTWLALSYWAQTQAATGTLATIIRPQGIPLDAWVAALPGGRTWNPVGEHWLRTWGVDLKVFALDRESRNDASYQPSRVTERRSLEVSEAGEFALDFWGLLEPATDDDPFYALDLQVLRRSLEAAHLGAPRQDNRKPPGAWAAAIDHVLDRTVGSGSGALRDFLLRKSEPLDNHVFRLAEAPGEQSDLDHHMRVLSRGLLLARVASGCSAAMCSTSGITVEKLRFWIDALIGDRGLWGTDPLPEDLTDLWADVNVAVENLKREIGSTVTSYYDLRSVAGVSALTLGGCERVALWSVA
jgi:hypothetical protein